MRFWKDASGAIITDEQLVRAIAYRGSLSAALEDGDVTLVSDTSSASEADHVASAPHQPVPRLADYLDIAEEPHEKR